MKFRKNIQKVDESKDTHMAISQKGIEISRKGEPISGVIPELVELDFRCSINRKGFRIIVEGHQNTKECSYKVVQVQKEEKLSSNKEIPKRIPTNLNINIEEIEGISIHQCPYCKGGKSAIIRCGCGGLSCGGGIKSEGGRDYHECPWCGSIGIIRGSIKSLTGARTPLHETLKVSNARMQTIADASILTKTLQSASKKQILLPGGKRITKK